MKRRFVAAAGASCLTAWLACGGAYDSDEPFAAVPSLDASTPIDGGPPIDSASPPISEAGAPPDARPPTPAPSKLKVTKTGTCEYAVEANEPDFDVNLFNVIGSPTCAAKVTLHIAKGVTLGARTTSAPALTIAGFAIGSAITVQNEGRIAGRGGDGGSGGNGGSGGTPRSCGRSGGKGGSALRIDAEVKLSSVGEIYGGGGGGAGASGGNENAGGGGGAGSQPGAAGAKATTLTEADEIKFCGQDNAVRTGTAGKPGTADTGGAAIVIDGSCQSGAGGAPGAVGKDSNCFGGASGGAAGRAIEYGDKAKTLPVPIGTSVVAGVKGAVAKVP